MKLLLVMSGGFFGAICRVVLDKWIQHINIGFPLGTFFINLIGCFILGWFLTFVSKKREIRLKFTLFIGTGFIGSFTTFSTFTMETVNLFQKGLIFMGILYILATTVLGLTLVFLGSKLALFRESGKNK